MFGFGEPDEETEIRRLLKDHPALAAAFEAEGGKHDVAHLDKLLLRGAPAAVVNHANAEGETPLMWAARNGYFSSTLLLLSCGVDPTRHDNRGQAPTTCCRRWRPRRQHVERALGLL